MILVSSLLFLSYDIYIVGSYIWFLFNKDKYGYVYQDIMIIPHFIFLTIGIVFNMLYYFKNITWMKYVFIISYLIGAIFLFI